MSGKFDLTLAALAILSAPIANGQQANPLQRGPQQPMTFFVTSEGSGHGAGNRTWHAYLSTQAAPGQPVVNARDRIGSSLTKITALTEKGDMIAGPPDDNQRHD